MAVILWLLLLVPSLAQAAIVWEDGFENHLNTGNLGQAGGQNYVTNWEIATCNPATLGWDFPDGCNPTIVTVQAHSGTHSLNSHYLTSCGNVDGTGQCGTFTNRYWGFERDIYSRFWIYLASNWHTNDFAGSKVMYYKSDSPPDSWLTYLHMLPSSNALTFRASHGGWTTTCPNGSSDQECNFPPNGPGNPTLPLNTWTCVETHVGMGTAGTATGTIEAWVNNVNIISYVGTASIATPAGGDNQRLTHLTHFAQLGVGDRYIDDLAVSTTRIGDCTGGPPVDSTPPTPPTASVTGTTGASMTVAWSGAADNVGGSGIAGYRLDASSVSNFASFLPGYQNLDVGNVASKVIGGLAGSTTYYSRVRAYDAAGNISVNSNTASGTTTTVPVSPTITSFVTDAAGFNETHTGTLGSYHLRYGDNAATFLIDTPLTLAQVPGGRYNITWPAATQWACLDPYDAGGVLNAAGTLCNTVTPGDVTAPAVPTGLTIAALAALLLMGGAYAQLARTAVSQSGLRPDLPDADATALRTVALHGSAGGGEARYAVVLDPGPSPAPARRLAPGPLDSTVADAEGDETPLDRGV